MQTIECSVDESVIIDSPSGEIRIDVLRSADGGLKLGIEDASGQNGFRKEYLLEEAAGERLSQLFPQRAR